MAQYKSQHWLPACYMKFFAISATPTGRSTRVYYTNANESKIGSVANLSCADFHYSRVEPEEAETSFHGIENQYPLTITKLLDGNSIHKIEYFQLILSIIDFHARNASYENRTPQENYKAFEHVSRGLIGEIFGDVGANFHKMLDFMEANWRFNLLHSPHDVLLSSDNPSMIFSLGNKIAFIFLPVHPEFGVVAFDRRKIEVTNNVINQRDNEILNSMQATVCINYVYSNTDLSDQIGEGEALTKLINRERENGFVEADCWKPNFMDYLTLLPDKFGFIAVKN